MRSPVLDEARQLERDGVVDPVARRRIPLSTALATEQAKRRFLRRVIDLLVQENDRLRRQLGEPDGAIPQNRSQDMV